MISSDLDDARDIYGSQLALIKQINVLCFLYKLNLFIKMELLYRIMVIALMAVLSYPESNEHKRGKSMHCLESYSELTAGKLVMG